MEIGCGVGVVSAHLNPVYGMDVIGTDVDPEQVEIAKEINLKLFIEKALKEGGILGTS